MGGFLEHAEASDKQWEALRAATPQAEAGWVYST
jgi:hypothetical protein